MALVLEDLVLETSSTTGTADFTLAGAETGFRTFSSAIGDGNTTLYCARNRGVRSEWETGIGTVSAGALARTTVLESSAGGGSKTTFSAGTKEVYCTMLGGRMLYVDGAIIIATGSSLNGIMKGDGSGTISAATAGTDYAKPNTNSSWTAGQRGAISALSYSASITLDFNTSNNFSIAALTGNITLNNPTNVTAGQSGIIELVQDGTGGRTLSLGTNWKKEGGNAITLSTAANAVDLLYYYARTTTAIYASLIKDVK